MIYSYAIFLIHLVGPKQIYEHTKVLSRDDITCVPLNQYINLIQPTQLFCIIQTMLL